MSLIVAQIAAHVILGTLGWGRASPSTLEACFRETLSAAISLALVYRYAGKKSGSLADLGLGPRPTPFLWPVARYLCFSLITYLIVEQIVIKLVPSVDMEQAQDLHLGEGPDAWYEHVAMGLFLVVVVPFYEEVVCRGFLLKGLAARFGWTPAIIASSLLFGAAHVQLNLVIFATILGVFLAQLTRTTASLWPAIVMHGLKNGMAFGATYMWP